MRRVENLEILVEGREAIIPLAEGKIDLATARLNFHKATMRFIGVATDLPHDDECFNSAANTYYAMYYGARQHYGWRD